MQNLTCIAFDSKKDQKVISCLIVLFLLYSVAVERFIVVFVKSPFQFNDHPTGLRSHPTFGRLWLRLRIKILAAPAPAPARLRPRPL